MTSTPKPGLDPVSSFEAWWSSLADANAPRNPIPQSPPSANPRFRMIPAVLDRGPGMEPVPVSGNIPSFNDGLAMDTSGYVPDRPLGARKALHDIDTLEGRIAWRENNLLANQFQAGVEAWTNGKAPKPILGPDGKPTGEYDWATSVEESGLNYLGLNPGYVAMVIPNKPGPDASYQELQRYEQALAEAVRPPLYKERSVFYDIMNMDMAARKNFQRNLMKAGLYPDDTPVILGNFGEAEFNAMRWLMSRANQNGLKWTEQLDLTIQWKQKQDAVDAASRGAGGGDGSNTVYTQVNYSTTSIGEARTLLISVLRNALGRYPTDEEVADFVAILNAQEKKSPTTTITRTSSGDTSTRSVSTVTPSTVDPVALAEEFASNIEGGDAEYSNKADRYLNALLQSLTGGS